MREQLKALMKDERDRLEKEKEIVKKDMKTKDNYIEQLNRQLKESQERCRVMEANMNSSERELKIQLLNYEKNMETLTTMYHSLASQKKLLSKDNKVIEYKLQRNKLKRKDLED